MKYNGNDNGNDNVNDNDNDGSIVASTRVFSRKISLGNSQICHVGGIGEVCTDESHRKKGLATLLLKNAIDAMLSSCEGMQCSLLHASPALTEVYEKSAGYQSVISHWSVIPMIVPSQSQDDGRYNDNDFKVRKASFPKDTPSLQRIHQEYSEKRFAGCIIRSIDYWNEYLREEIGDSIFVLTTATATATATKEDEILAWMSIRARSGVRFQLRDFGCCRRLCGELGVDTATAFVFPILLQEAMEGQNIDEDAASASSASASNSSALELHLPTAILKEMQMDGLSPETCDWIDWARGGIYEEDDVGWMYKSLNGNTNGIDNDNVDAATSTVLVDMRHIVEELMVEHLIWPADSF